MLYMQEQQRVIVFVIMIYSIKILKKIDDEKIH